MQAGRGPILLGHFHHDRAKGDLGDMTAVSFQTGTPAPPKSACGVEGLREPG